jgi:hypothetical protein
VVGHCHGHGSGGPLQLRSDFFNRVSIILH